MIEDSLYQYLSAQPAVTAYLGVGDDCRIYPANFPQNPELPAMMYELISLSYNRTIDGYLYSVPRFQFNIIGHSALSCSLVSGAIASVLDNY
ncbi:MAG: hypothetical protein DRN81_04980, partial [Thermoproteota archaeon]